MDAIQPVPQENSQDRVGDAAAAAAPRAKNAAKAVDEAKGKAVKRQEEINGLQADYERRICPQLCVKLSRFFLLTRRVILSSHNWMQQSRACQACWLQLR